MTTTSEPGTDAGLDHFRTLVALQQPTWPDEAALDAVRDRLAASAPLVVADGCEASGSYIIDFTVTTQGRTADIAPPDAPACVREALAAWAASFQFSPPSQPVRSSIEWLLVTAPRGS